MYVLRCRECQKAVGTCCDWIVQTTLSILCDECTVSQTAVQLFIDPDNQQALQIQKAFRSDTEYKLFQRSIEWRSRVAYFIWQLEGNSLGELVKSWT